MDHFTVSTVWGNNSIFINWRISDPVLHQVLDSVLVMVSSECPTGIQPTQTQTFNVMASQGNFVNATGLGILINIGIMGIIIGII